MFLQPTRSECKILGYSFVSSLDVWVFNTPSQVGMEQAWVGQKLVNVTFYEFLRCPIL